MPEAFYLTDPRPPFSPPSENPDPRVPVTPPPDPTGDPVIEPDVPEKPLPNDAPELPDRPAQVLNCHTTVAA